MNIDKYEEAAFIAQKISFAYEDVFYDKEKSKLFYTFFNSYLMRVDPEGSLVPYDALILLWRTYPDQFAQMLKEMTEKGLVPD